MNNVVKEIKEQVKISLEAALEDLKEKEDMSGIDDALLDTREMCTAIQKMYGNHTMETASDAAEGKWARIADRFNDC